MKHVFQQFEPTPARGKFREELYDDPKWSAEQKYDGDRRIAQFCEEAVRFTGRRHSVEDGLLVEKTENLPQMNEAVPGLIGTVLDGEIIHPAVGARSNMVASVMGSLPARAAQIQATSGFLEYRVFDCLFYKGVDMRSQGLDARRAVAWEAVKEWENRYVAKALVARENKLQFLHSIWARGGEGIILKHNDSLYIDKKQWVKVKREFTVDVVIMGYEEPNAESTKVNGETSVTKYKANGWIGAISIGQYNAKGELVNVGSVSGMKESMRAELSRRIITKNGRQAEVDGGAKYVGHVIEIEANEREDSGRFRHGRFIRMRPDKDPSECKLPGVK